MTGPGTAERPAGAARADGIVRPVGESRSEARLPVVTVQCHAANLTALPDGELACVWFGGTQEGTHDISVYLSRLPSGADTWTPAIRMSDDPDRSEQNPLLFVTPAGAVWLVYTAQSAGNQDTAEVRARVSDDGGRTWGEPHTVIPADSRGGVFVRQPPVFLPDGRWVLPVFRCVRVPGQKWAGDRDTSSVFISNDDGASFVECDVPGSMGAVHMNILPTHDGGFAALYRSRWADHIYRSTSSDGVTWGAPQPLDLPNNNSSIQAAVAPGGVYVLAFNDASAADATARRESLYDEIADDGTVVADDSADDSVVDGGAGGTETGSTADGISRAGRAADADRRAFWGAPRAPMTLALSHDDGLTWPRRLVIEDGDGYCLSNDSRSGRNHELSYPSAHVDDDGTVHLAYTHHRSAIAYVRLDPSWLGGPIDT